MRIGIVGAGALGTSFGYRLAERHTVSLLEVRPEVAGAIARDGLRLDDGPPRMVAASTLARGLFGAQALFVFVRTTETLHALRPFLGNLDPACAIVTLQGGVANDDAVKAVLGSQVALVVGATTESALTLGPGSARSVGTGTTILGTAGAAPDVCARIADALRECGIATTVAYDIRPHLWGKLVASAAISPVAALLDRPNGVVLDQPAAGELARAIAGETAMVAAALRIALPFPDPWRYVRAIAQQTAELRNSMSIDLERGELTEIDHLNGAVVNAARRLGIAAPYNDALVRLIHARESLAGAR